MKILSWSLDTTIRAAVQNETVIGSESTGQGSNTVTIGNASVTEVCLSQDKGATVYAGALDVTAATGITLENDEAITTQLMELLKLEGTCLVQELYQDLMLI